MLRIEYDTAKQNAIIIASKGIPEYAWGDIQSLYLESYKQVESIGPWMLRVPWWIFLNLKNDFAYYLHKYKIEPEYDENVLSLLLEAKEIENLYINPSFDREFTTEELKTYLIQNGFSRRLTDQQARNVIKMIQFPAAATFSVPGAGKTTEALAYFFLRKKENTKLLVVAPKNAFAAWEEQLFECLPHANYNIIRLQGGENGVEEAFSHNPTIALITYQQLFRVEKSIAKFLTLNESFMYLDESHRMKKGFDGVYGSSILNLAHLPKCKLILSGTPMPNKLSDLIPQFNFLYPEIKSDDTNIVQNIRKVYSRTTKKELGLKDPVRYQKNVWMNPAQKKLYDNLRSEAARQIENLSISDRIQIRSFGRSVVRLIQVTTEPALLAETSLSNHRLLRDAILEGASPKILEACRIARELAIKNQKCIIWSQFVQIVETIADQLADLGAVYIHGGVETDDDEENTESREALIKRFHDDPSCMVMVANPAACSEGISLHKICHHAIYVDRNYNAAQYLQSEDRIHRLGLSPSEETYITILHCPESIDDSISRRLTNKVELMRNILNDNTLNIEPLQIIDDDYGFVKEDIDDIRSILFGGK